MQIVEKQGYRYKEDASRFKIFHVQPEVEKILKMTGFDKLLIDEAHV